MNGTTKVMNNNEKGSWKDTTNNILNRNTNDTQTPTPNGIVKRFQETINKKAEGKTKTQYLFKNTQWQAGKRKPYMNKLNRMETSIIFKTRTRMLDIKANFKNKYQQQKCRMCNKPIETQEHILETCPGLHTTNKTKVYKNEIFDEDTNNLKLTTAKITQTMAQLNQNNNHTQSTDPNNV